MSTYSLRAQIITWWRYSGRHKSRLWLCRNTSSNIWNVEILCKRLKSKRGIVSTRVALCHDLLRLSLGFRIFLCIKNTLLVGTTGVSLAEKRAVGLTVGGLGGFRSVAEGVAGGL